MTINPYVPYVAGYLLGDAMRLSQAADVKEVVPDAPDGFLLRLSTGVVLSVRVAVVAESPAEKP